MGKMVKAVKPFVYKNNINFKVAIYNAWVETGGKKVDARPYEFLYKSLSHHLSLPTLFQNKKQVRLRFCEAISLRFDTFPDYLCYEVIPLFWDCWPGFFNQVAEWMKNHHVRTAFFTSVQVAEKMKKLCPNVHIFHLPEGIETNLYKEGKRLVIGESRIVCLDKVSYLCAMILNYSNYGTRQETIKQQAKVRRGCNR